MIPWFDIHLPSLGPIALHSFGMLVAIGIWIGAAFTQRRARELGLAADAVQSMITTVVIVGFIVAHLFDVVAYQAAERPVTWRVLLDPFGGLSSFGGFAGALAALIVWVWRRHERLLSYADALAFGLAPGWLLGRLGCFTAHDHPGRLTDFFLAVRYPDGARHDLGLDEAFGAAVLSALFLLLSRQVRKPGTYVVLAALAYAPFRFALDFLRATDVARADPRYWALTPAQYGCLALFVAGALLARAVRATPWREKTMRRSVNDEDGQSDRLESAFDVRRLESGDAVEVYLDDERRWAAGTFEITTAGVAVITRPSALPIRFDLALRMGLRGSSRTRSSIASGNSSREQPPG